MKKSIPASHTCHLHMFPGDLHIFCFTKFFILAFEKYKLF